MKKRPLDGEQREPARARYCQNGSGHAREGGIHLRGRRDCGATLTAKSDSFSLKVFTASQSVLAEARRS